MTEAIRPVRGDIQVEDGIVSMRLERVYRKSQVCEPRAKLLRRLVNVDEFLKPVEADFHSRQHAVGAVGRVNESGKMSEAALYPSSKEGNRHAFTVVRSVHTLHDIDHSRQNCSRNRISFWKKSW